MIPTFDIAKAAIAPYLMWAKIGAVLAVALACGAFYLHYKHLEAKAERVDAAEARAEAVEANARQTLSKMAADQKASQKASEGYLNEIASLRARPVGPVRVSIPARVPAPRAATGRPDAEVPPSGVVPGGVESDSGVSRDIGPDLSALMVEADKCSAQLRGLEAWITATR